MYYLSLGFLIIENMRQALREVPLKHYLLLLFVFLLVFLVYFQGVGNFLVFDSRAALEKLYNPYFMPKSLAFDELYVSAMSSVSGPLRRPVSMLSFTMNAWLFGEQSWIFYAKLFNVALHLFNACLLFVWLKLLFTGSPVINRHPLKGKQYIPLLVTIFWLVAPIHQNAVLYLVQRMTLLSATFVLFALIVHAVYFFKVSHLSRGKLAELGVWLFVLVTLAVFSKESGIMAVPALWLVHRCLYSGHGSFDKNHPIMSLFTVVFVAAALLVVTYAFMVGFSAYELRDFTLLDRLYTQPRVLFFYLKMMLLPSVADYGLFHDDYQISSSLLQPVQTLPALLLIVVAVFISLLLIDKKPLFAFPVLWYLGMHAMESTVFPLEMVFEHRNYLPSIGVFLLLGLMFSAAADTSYMKLSTLLAGIVVTLCLFTTFMLAAAWQDRLQMAKLVYDNKPQSARAAYIYAIQLMNIAEVSENPVVRKKAWNDAETALRSALQIQQDTQQSRGAEQGVWHTLIELKSLRNDHDLQSIYEEYLQKLDYDALAPSGRNSLLEFINCVHKQRCNVDLKPLEKKLFSLEQSFFYRWKAEYENIINDSPEYALEYLDKAINIEGETFNSVDYKNAKIHLLTEVKRNSELVPELVEVSQKKDFYFSLLSLKKRLVFK